MVLVDWPEFNLRLASSLHRRGLKVIYYISASYGPGVRDGSIASNATSICCCRFFRSKLSGTKREAWTTWSLSAILCRRGAWIGREEFCSSIIRSEQANRFVLPGSRRKELERILPPMAGAIRKLKETHPEIQPVVVVAQPQRKQKRYFPR